MSDRLAAVVLAAGAGSRFGGDKLLAPYGAGLLLDGALKAAFFAPVDAVIVVTGHDPEAVGRRARWFAASVKAPDRLRLAHAADHGEGMAASLRAGLLATPETADAAFVFLGDMPRIPPDAPLKLASALGDHLAAAPMFEGRQGHPVLFRRSLFASLTALKGDQGGRDLLRSLGATLIRVPVADSGVLFDVDRKEDLAR